MKSFPSRRILALGFGLALIIELVIGVVSYRNVNRLVQTAESVHHSREILVRLEDVLGDLTVSVSKTREKLEILRRLTADNTEQRKRFEDLDPKVKERLAQLEQMSDEEDEREGEEEPEPEGKRKVSSTVEQRALMGEIGGLISQMEAEEKVLLSQRDEAARASARSTTFTLFVGGTVSFGLLFLVFTFLGREVTERQKAEQVSHAQTETLVKTLNALASESDLGPFSGQVLKAVAEQLGAHSASLWFYDESRSIISPHMVFEGGRIKSLEEISSLSRQYSSKTSLGWQEFSRKRLPLVIREGDSNPLLAPIQDWTLSLNVKTMLFVPLVLADEVIGCIALGNTEIRNYPPEKLELVQALAQQLSLSIQLTRLAERGQQSAVLEERNRMAQEIHDTLAQGFTGIVVHLEVAEDALAGDSDEARAHLRRAQDLARQSLAEARRSMWALRPHALEASDLAGALKNLADRLIAGTPIQVKFSVRGVSRPLPVKVEANLLRIGQEALTNVLKHAHAKEVRIELSFDGEAISLGVSDDGVGFNPSLRVAKAGFGLVGMRERAQGIGGELTLTSQPGHGTQVLVAVPLRAQESGVIAHES
jgi:signal transduction histidine kinase